MKRHSSLQIGLALFLVFTAAKTADAWTLASTSLEGWQTNNLVVTVNTSDCTVSDSVLLPLIDQALNVWNGVPTANITLSRSATPSTSTVTDFKAGSATTPLIICDPNFGADNSSDPSFADEVPAATQIGQDNPLDYAGIMLNAQSGAADNIANLVTENPNLLVITLAHEMGHVMGLGHSGNANALMYYSISNKTTAQLTQDDMDGISFLYPRDEFSSGTFGCSSVHSTRLVTPSLGWFLVTFCLGACGMWLSRRMVRFEPLP